MPETYLDCPKCQEEIEFEVEHESAEDGEWYSAGMVKQSCECELSDAQITILEGNASFKYADGIHNYEP